MPEKLKYTAQNKPVVFKAVIFGLLLFLIITVLNVSAPGHPGALERFLAALIIVLGSIPIFLFVHNYDSGIPFLPLFGIIYSLYYALPVFLLDKFTLVYVQPTQEAILKALLFCVVGILMLLFSYYRMPGGGIGRFIPRISIRWDPAKAKFWAVILGGAGLLFNYLQLIAKIPVQFGQVVLFLSELLLIAIGILFILQLQGRLGRVGKLLLWLVFLPSIILIRLGTGSIAQVLMVAVFLLFCYWYFRKRIPWKLIVAIGLVFIVFSSAKVEFRRFAAGGKNYADKSPVEKSILFARLAFSNPAVLQRGRQVAAERTSHCLLTFAHVIEFTPNVIPYWMGQSYRGLLWAPIPRVICPWKPKITLGQEFGHRYYFLPEIDLLTSWNLPQLVEMYVNFGISGIIIGMFLLGIIYRALSGMFCHPDAGEGGLLIGFFVFTRLTLIESDFATVFGNLIYYIILLIIIGQLMKERTGSA